MTSMRILGFMLLGVVLSTGYAHEVQPERVQISGTLLEFNASDLIVSNDDHAGNSFCITPDGGLFIRGREVDLSTDGKALLHRYYNLAGKLTESTDQLRSVGDSAHAEVLRQHRMVIDLAQTRAREIARQSKLLVDSLARARLQLYWEQDWEQLGKHRAEMEALKLDMDRLRVEALAVASDSALQTVRQQINAAKELMDNLKQIQSQMWESIPQLRDFPWLHQD